MRSSKLRLKIIHPYSDNNYYIVICLFLKFQLLQRKVELVKEIYSLLTTGYKSINLQVPATIFIAYDFVPKMIFIMLTSLSQILISYMVQVMGLYPASLNQANCGASKYIHLTLLAT